jgi:nucleotide-binding universal stress UspA family protein
MWDRMLLAIDGYESGQHALDFTTRLAVDTGTEVRVLHIRAMPVSPRVPPLETPSEASILVEEAVFCLRMAGVAADGTSCAERENQVARRIVEESTHQGCDVIVLGSRRLRGVHRLSGRGVRQRVVRLSSLPVITAPTPARNGRHRILRPGS